MAYRVLAEFEHLFAGKAYRHRASNQGDFIAMHLYEDLVGLGRSASPKLVSRVQAQDRILATTKLRHGVQARRGDGTFGEPVPGTTAIPDPGFAVARGTVATVEIGVEVKILAKAMIKQIDRVINDLQKQVVHFRHRGGNTICVALVGINHAPYAVSYERDRVYTTDGRENRHPVQEAAEAERRLRASAAAAYDAFIVLNYSATNDPPFAFSWENQRGIEQDYGAELVRISRLYDQRF